MLTVLLGGARSGKSGLAERIGRSHDRGAVTYLATSPHIPGDHDLDRRIALHRSSRPPQWRTIEEEVDLAGALGACGNSLVIVDCLTVWLGNLMHRRFDDDAIAAASAAALRAVEHRAAAGEGDTIVVSNEVGLGIVPERSLSRRYRDIMGRLNQDWVRASDRAYFLLAGRALILHDLDEIVQ